MTTTALRPYQEEAVQALAAALKAGGKGQIHMACGSGKTLVGTKAAEWMLGQATTVAVLTPSLALVAQTLNAWRQYYEGPLSALAVCWDDTVIDAPLHLDQLTTPVTTCPEVIIMWLRRPANGLRLVVGTYKSAERLAEAVRATAPLDFLILDEAHHLTGRPDAVTRRAVDNTWLPAARRLFMTATPRVDTRSATAGSKPVPMIAMNDTELFGPVLATYPFARGIAEGYLDDYRILVVGVPDQQAHNLLSQWRTEYAENPYEPSLSTMVAQIALARAREEYGIRTAITFHPRIAQAAEFARTLPRTIARILPQAAEGLHADHVNGTMDHQVRNSVLDKLRQPPPGGWSVISNARCLGEGVDVPAVSAVLFAHPKRSAVDITQAVGRALRRHPDIPGPATIIVPIPVPHTDEPITDLDPGQYFTLWQVIRSLRAHDEALAANLNYARTNLHTGNVELPHKITVSLPPGSSEALLRQITLLLIQQTTSTWWDTYAAAAQFHAEHGHLDVPADLRTAGGVQLANWLNTQRHNHRKGRLAADRVRKLDAIGIDWNPLDSFEDFLALARRYHREHGRLPTGATRIEGHWMGIWLSDMRKHRAEGRLLPERIAALDALGMEWDTLSDARWKRGMTEARAYLRAHGHFNVPRTHVTDSGYHLGDWLNTQRVKHRKGELAPERAAELQELGFVLNALEARWQRGYQAACDYHAQHGDLKVHSAHVTEDGFKLGTWLVEQRRNRKKGALPEQRAAALDAIGMRWQ
ncbi:Helicase associated domain protein [Streptomyces sp. NPDC029704]|uniref:DEAD/DEAH box helicase n=1 Tax=Streptomyces sp. NPDC029704 TaxID=3156920 RepID=UPI0033C8D888